MVKDAERYQQEDQKRKEEIEVRNNADSAVYQAEKLMREMGDKVPAEMRADVESKLNALKDAMKGREIDPIKRRIDDLQQALMKIGEHAYQGASGGGTPPPGGFATDGGSQGGGPQGGQQGGQPGGGGETVEGEYREV